MSHHWFERGHAWVECLLDQAQRPQLREVLATRSCSLMVPRLGFRLLGQKILNGELNQILHLAAFQGGAGL